jgi:hypothetical protein
VTGSRELLWPCDVVSDVVAWARDSAIGILGGEVYTRLGPMNTSFVSDWNTTPEWSPGENWRAFVDRGAAQAIEAVTASHKRADRESRRADIHFFFAFIEIEKPA